MKNCFKFLLVGVLALSGFQVHAAQRRNRPLPSTPVGVATRPGTTNRTGLPVPSVGKTYTVGQLKDLINRNNPNKTSNFLVAINGKDVVMDRDSWATTGGKITNITGSASVAGAGLTNIINENLSKEVTLSADSTLINHLAANGVLDGATKDSYSKILLYFTLNGYRFYLNDPNPGKIVRSGRVSRSPAASIISKWNLNERF